MCMGTRVYVPPRLLKPPPHRISSQVNDEKHEHSVPAPTFRVAGGEQWVVAAAVSGGEYLHCCDRTIALPAAVPPAVPFAVCSVGAVRWL